MSVQLNDDIAKEFLEQDVYEHTLPVNIYNIKIASADGSTDDIFKDSTGKVTLLFNVAAGCGNIPQHRNLEILRQMYENRDDFQIIAVTVDDFVCHGYQEFQDGLDKYIERNNLDLTPGQVAQKYAIDNYGVKYNFTQLTNGRHDKHTYDTNYTPGSIKLQEQHELWHYLTFAYQADLQDNGVPYYNEEIPWSKYKSEVPDNKKSSSPLSGNFTKFLIDKTGTKFKRYGNGFLLGERDVNNNMFPWFEEKYTEDGWRDHNPSLGGTDIDDVDGPYPNKKQLFGIDVSLKIISNHIDNYLGQD